MIDARTKDRIAALYARAVHSGTPEEEARTSALLCLKLVARHDVAFVAPGDQPPEPPASSNGKAASGQDRAKGRTGRSGARSVRIRSRYDGWCKVCGDEVYVGDEVYWHKGRGVAHAECGDGF
jgi:hypothetical protein